MVNHMGAHVIWSELLASVNVMNPSESTEYFVMLLRIETYIF